MMDLTVQYIVIFVLFAIAVFFLWKKFFPSEAKKNGCGSSHCKCDQQSTKQDNLEKNPRKTI